MRQIEFFENKKSPKNSMISKFAVIYDKPFNTFVGTLIMRNIENYKVENSQKKKMISQFANFEVIKLS